MRIAVEKRGVGELGQILGVWLGLVVLWFLAAAPNMSMPGLYYDEVHCAGMAKDFLSGQPHLHMVGCKIVNFWGRPFPLFVQPYGGAIKSWLMIPSFALFGANQTVLRLTALSWGLMALLVCMLWIWKWLGRTTALLTGILLASDPTFFFISVLDWGPVLPSFLCRFAFFYFALAWWRLARESVPEDGKSRRRIIWRAGLAGLFAGLGFFNKIDFIVLLGGVLVALACCEARGIWANPVRCRPVTMVAAAVGFLIGACIILPSLPGVLHGVPGATAQQRAVELASRFRVFMAMCDGSYFYRLMDAGGVFARMFRGNAPIMASWGIYFIPAAAYLGLQTRFRGPAGKAAMFIILSSAFIALGIFLLPCAREVQIHHMVMIYPFPHLAIAFALARLWRSGWKVGGFLFAAVIACQTLDLARTQQLIMRTGGRGWWSDAVTAFASQIKDRTDLTLVSMDWGFNEQMAFLTDGPKLAEPFWSRQSRIPGPKDCVYLVHPPEYARLSFGRLFLEQALHGAPTSFEVKAWRDHEGQVAFYSIRYLGP